MAKNATKQALNNAGRGGIIPPKERQFGQPNGNLRHSGAWKKEDTPRFKLEQMLRLTESELTDLVSDKDAPLFERRIARSLLKENEFRTTEAMINQVYGTPKERKEVDVSGEISGININVRKYDEE